MNCCFCLGTGIVPPLHGPDIAGLTLIQQGGRGSFWNAFL